MPASYRDARGHRRRQHRVAIGLVLGVEGVGARHRDDARVRALLREELGRVHREPDLGAGGDQDRVGLPRSSGGARSRPSGCRRSARRSDLGWARPWRLKIRLVGPSRRSIATRQATADSTASQGRQTPMRGISRRVAVCSTGWWVGPSLADADRVVGEHEDVRRLHESGHAERVPLVLREHQEGRDVGAEAPVQRDAVGHARHRELAHAVVDVVARGVVVDDDRALPQGQVRAREVGRAADELGEVRARSRRARSGRPSADAIVSPFSTTLATNASAFSGQSAGSSPASRRSSSAASSGCASR